jgi:hypothetical protein
VTWFKVDDKFHASEEVMSIPLPQRAGAIGLWTLSGAWSSDHLKNGFVPVTHLETWGGTVEMAEVLVTAKLWTRVGKRGYQFRNWAKWQITREQVESNREREREKKAGWRAAKAAKTEGSPDGVPGGQVPRPQVVPSIPTRPDPTRPDQERKAPAGRGSRVPNDFKISDDMRAWAAQNTPLVNVDSKLGEWRDYWAGVAGAKGVRTDWEATWRNGMRKQQEWAKKDRPRGSDDWMNRSPR